MIDTYEYLARAIHDYDRRDRLIEVPPWSKLKKADKDRYFGFAGAVIEALERDRHEP